MIFRLSQRTCDINRLFVTAGVREYSLLCDSCWTRSHRDSPLVIGDGCWHGRHKQRQWNTQGRCKTFLQIGSCETSAWLPRWLIFSSSSLLFQIICWEKESQNFVSLNGCMSCCIRRYKLKEKGHFQLYTQFQNLSIDFDQKTLQFNYHLNAKSYSQAAIVFYFVFLPTLVSHSFRFVHFPLITIQLVVKFWEAFLIQYWPVQNFDSEYHKLAKWHYVNQIFMGQIIRKSLTNILICLSRISPLMILF